MENFIEDILSELIGEAEEIKANLKDEFDRGKVFGYYHSISNIISQAVAFGVFEKLSRRLQHYKPESLLNDPNV